MGPSTHQLGVTPPGFASMGPPHDIDWRQIGVRWDPKNLGPSEPTSEWIGKAKPSAAEASNQQQAVANHA